MNLLSILGFFYFINQIFVIHASDGTTLPKSYSYIRFIQLKIRNSLLRRLVQSDYKSMKKHILLLTDCAKEKINNTYEDFLTNYYNNVLHYYSMEEKDVFILDNLSQLLL